MRSEECPLLCNPARPGGRRGDLRSPACRKFEDVGGRPQAAPTGNAERIRRKTAESLCVLHFDVVIQNCDDKQGMFPNGHS